MTRRFTAAYVGHNGTIHPIGDGPYIDPQYALAEVEQFHAEDDQNEYLVAFRDMPEWQRWTEDR